MRHHITVSTVLLAVTHAATAQLDFSSAVNFNAGLRPEGLAAGDFDGDGDIDLATTIEDPDRIRILLRQGTTYTLATATALPSSSSPQDLIAGDFDEDGDVDLAVAVRDPQGAVLIFKNGGAGGFTLFSTAPVGERPRGLAVGDIDGDGDLDLAVANRDSDTASILENGGGGSFTPTNFDSGAEPRAAALGDIDGDDDLDFVVANHDERTVDVWRRQAGGFVFLVTLAAGSQSRPEDVALADVDGNGLADIIVSRGDDVLAQNRISVIRSLGGGNFAAAASFPTGGFDSAALALADFDDNGAIDIAVANEGGATVSLLRNTGNGGFVADLLRSVGLHPDDIVAADLDGDGDMDVAVANRDSNTISILSNNSTGAPTQTPPSNLVASDGTSSGSVSLTWDASAGATQHEIWRRRIGGPAAQPIATRPGGSLSFTDSTVQPGVTYRYWVRSRFGAQWSDFSAPDTGFASTAPNGAPLAPGAIVATDGTSSAYVLVTWTLAPGATSYQVWRAPLGGAAAPLGESTNGALWFTDTSAVPGVTYKYWVRGRNVFGWGPFIGPELGTRAGG